MWGGLDELLSLRDTLCSFRCPDSNSLFPGDWKPEVLEAAETGQVSSDSPG